MAKINLLPWREELRQQKKKDFVNSIFLAVLMVVFVFGLVHMYFDGQKGYQEQRNKLLQKEIEVLDQKIIAIKDIEEKKSKLLEKIDLIKKLQTSRPEIVHLMDEIPRLTPDGIYLTKFIQLGNDLTFEGKSESNARISAFMNGIESSKWLQQPKLDVIKASEKGNNNESDFILHAKQSHTEPNTEKKDMVNGAKVAKGGKK